MFKTTIMVNKREKNLLYNSDKRLSSFFIFLILTLSFYYFLLFPQLFRFNFVVSERNVHILFCRHIWAELSLLFWTFLRGTFFSPCGGGGGGSARAPSATPPLRTRLVFRVPSLICGVISCHFEDFQWNSFLVLSLQGGLVDLQTTLIPSHFPNPLNIVEMV